jgi:hypothetical protein
MMKAMLIVLDMKIDQRFVESLNVERGNVYYAKKEISCNGAVGNSIYMDCPCV